MNKKFWVFLFLKGFIGIFSIVTRKKNYIKVYYGEVLGIRNKGNVLKVFEYGVCKKRLRVSDIGKLLIME